MRTERTSCSAISWFDSPRAASAAIWASRRVSSVGDGVEAVDDRELGALPGGVSSRARVAARRAESCGPAGDKLPGPRSPRPPWRTSAPMAAISSHTARSASPSRAARAPAWAAYAATSRASQRRASRSRLAATGLRTRARAQGLVQQARREVGLVGSAGGGEERLGAGRVAQRAGAHLGPGQVARLGRHWPAVHPASRGRRPGPPGRAPGRR